MLVLFLLALILIVVLLIGLSVFIAHTIVHGNRQTMDEAWQWQMDHAPGCRIFRREDFTDYTIADDTGYTLHVSYLPAKETGSDKYVILAHGYTDTRWGALKYIQFYYALGFHCICFDQRGHGENEPAPCSYAVRESKSLMAVLRDTLQRYGTHIRIGLHGESLGGATVLESLQYHLDTIYPEYDHPVRFAVDDCGFSDILPILKAGLRTTRIPGFMVYPASLAAKLMYGISFTASRPLDSVRGNHLPLLIMHGAEDDFILPDQSANVKNTTEGYAELHYFPHAGHAGSAITDPDRYFDILRAFLIEIKFLQ